LYNDALGVYNAIDWNAVLDMMDKLTYEKATSQFWLSTRMPVSKDRADWAKASSIEKRLIEDVFGGLTLLDTLQSEDGLDALKKDAATQHEIAVLNNFQFMESEHARSYSSIFSTLNTKSEIVEIFRRVRENEKLQFKAKVISDVYENGEPLQKKIISVFLESFLFYSGFYTPLYYLGQGRFINVAEIIKLIIRDESLHGAYIGHKFKVEFKKLSTEEQNELQSWAYDILYKLYQNEVKYTEELYDEVGWTEDVKVFLRYNANRALMNLGLSPLFPETADDVNPIVINGLSTGTTNNDFFSTVGNGYLLSTVEPMRDEDYDY
jgi:ribonucleoside-diphosphate reductase beta chain